MLLNSILPDKNLLIKTEGALFHPIEPFSNLSGYTQCATGKLPAADEALARDSRCRVGQKNGKFITHVIYDERLELEAYGTSLFL